MRKSVSFLFQVPFTIQGDHHHRRVIISGGTDYTIDRSNNFNNNTKDYSRHWRREYSEAADLQSRVVVSRSFSLVLETVFAKSVYLEAPLPPSSLHDQEQVIMFIYIRQSQSVDTGRWRCCLWNILKFPLINCRTTRSYRKLRLQRVNIVWEEKSTQSWRETFLEEQT